MKRQAWVTITVRRIADSDEERDRGQFAALAALQGSDFGIRAFGSSPAIAASRAVRRIVEDEPKAFTPGGTP